MYNRLSKTFILSRRVVRCEGKGIYSSILSAADYTANQIKANSANAILVSIKSQSLHLTTLLAFN